MNKKLICLLLSVLMLLSVVLTACGEKDDDDALEEIAEEASAAAVTLSMYLMSEAPVSAEQELAIENAVNDITKAKFKAKMDLTFLTANDYYRILEENLKKQSENAALYFTDDEVKGGEPETEKDDLGIETLKYPALKPNQVDIFYFSGYDKYVSYYNEEYLASLGTEIEGDAKALKAYLTPSLLSYMKSVNGGIYAVPTNRPIGEYTYLLLNKGVLNEMYYDVDPEHSEFSSLVCDNVQDILSYVANSDLKDTYVPLHSFTGELDIINYQYWGVDENGFLSNKFSALGGRVDPTWTPLAANSYSPVNNVFTDEAFLSQLKILNQYKQNGYYDAAAVNDQDNPKEFAVGYIKGGEEDIVKYRDKYEVVPVAMPTLYTEDLYQHLFGVSAYSMDMGRSMDILTYLNTNEEFRNLLLYGIEGENYELVDSAVRDANGDFYKQVKVAPNNTYKMDVNKTGNVLMAYTTVDQDPLLREYAKTQNRDIKISYYMGLQLDYGGLVIHADYFQDLRKLSETLYAELMAKDAADVTDEYLTSLSGRVRATFAYTHLTDIEALRDELNDKEGCSFMYLYFEWLTAEKIYIPPKEE